jgi:CheY-like chemotaxis protein
MAMADERVRTNIKIGQRCRVLCVDDDVLTLHLLSLILERQGYEVCTSSDPTAAIKVLKQEAVDLALLDYEMPQMNGGELASGGEM